ncbi:hypothetical protein [Haloarcula marina]|uniref:hypothetical protein n=1 Tax=Haloarcula marina TaxID=2961574 RepID=UPI0020B8F4E5|nr:hypothetical protein [Halomicroarcula marina]
MALDSICSHVATPTFGYVVAAGLEQAIHYVESVWFDAAVFAYLVDRDGGNRRPPASA